MAVVQMAEVGHNANSLTDTNVIENGHVSPAEHVKKNQRATFACLVAHISELGLRLLPLWILRYIFDSETLIWTSSRSAFQHPAAHTGGSQLPQEAESAHTASVLLF